MPSRRILIAPSMLSADFSRLGEEVQALEAAGADWLHWDCMDGHFTRPLTHGPLILQAVRSLTRLYFDAHLMIAKPEAQIPLFAEAGADGLAIHFEATPEPARLLQQIRSHGCKACLTVNPPTPLEAIEPLLPHCDVIMLMGVMPGYAGQPYDRRTTERIAAVRAMIERQGLPTLIEVDGGLNEQTTRWASEAGADVIVSASFIFRHPKGYAAAIAALRHAAECSA